MQCKKVVGFGILNWVIAFIVASIFVAYKADSSLAAEIIIPVAVGITAFYLSTKLPARTMVESLCYSVGWVIIAAILDMVATVPFTGWEIFTEWHIWLGYGLIFIAPIITQHVQA